MHLSFPHDQVLCNKLNEIFTNLLKDEADEKNQAINSLWEFKIDKEGGVALPNNPKLAKAFRQASKAYPAIKLESLHDLISQYHTTKGKISDEIRTELFIQLAKTISQKHQLNFGDVLKRNEELRKLFFKPEHTNPRITSTPAQTERLLNALEVQRDAFITSVKQQYIANIQHDYEELIKESSAPQWKLMLDLSPDLQTNFTTLKEKHALMTTFDQAHCLDLLLSKFYADRSERSIALQGNETYHDRLTEELRALADKAMPQTKADGKLLQWMNPTAQPLAESGKTEASQTHTKSCCVIA